MIHIRGIITPKKLQDYSSGKLLICKVKIYRKKCENEKDVLPRSTCLSQTIDHILDHNVKVTTTHAVIVHA